MGKSGEMEGATEKNRKREQKERVRKLKSENEKGRDVSGDGGVSGEEKARKRREDENIVETKESDYKEKQRRKR